MPIPFKSEEIAHKEFLKFQIEVERLTDKLHKDTDATLNKIISRNVGADGLIAKHKLKKIVDVYMTTELRKYRKDLKKMITVGVSNSSNFGMRSIISAVAPNRNIVSKILKDITRRVKKRIVNTRGIDGLTLSERVWKLSGDNTHQLKKLMSSGILQGNSAAKISRDIRGFLLRPETLRGRVKDLLRPGQGVYRSAYKNALRMTRTETARAYIDGQKDTAKMMGYKLKFQLSPSHPTYDICDPFQGRIFEPNEFPAPVHPNCLCYGLTVLAQ